MEIPGDQHLFGLKTHVWISFHIYNNGFQVSITVDCANLNQIFESVYLRTNTLCHIKTMRKMEICICQNKDADQLRFHRQDLAYDLNQFLVIACHSLFTIIAF